MIINRLRFRTAHYFKIDDLGKGIASKVIFILMLAVRIGPHFLPSEYSDFQPLYDWFNAVLMTEEVTDDMLVIPITTQNYIFLGLSCLSIYICVILALLYCGLYTRHLRNLSDMNPNIPMGRFIGRYLVLSLVFLVLSVPAMFIVVYLLLLFILAIPFICTIPACYMSGDKGFFSSIGSTVRRTRGHYLLMMRDLSGIIIIYLIISLIIGLIELASPTTSMVLNCGLSVLFYLVFARFCAFQYAITKKI
ncbi:hypothetical protein SAMN02910456_00338 [Ruminococcaceae bacterium YRB3002]|nr:hypothetical protein SAMN02910456_00338 [Ruminococcaceae bacterium YRB3002]